MANVKYTIKKIFRISKTLFLLDKLNFLIALVKNRAQNNQFRKRNPDFKLPSDYYLYETYKLDYNAYKEDGYITAKEMIEWSSVYVKSFQSILEWGCGVSRIIRHLPNFCPATCRLYGCDINREMIRWNQSTIGQVDFEAINYLPPTRYQEKSFDLVYALSVFTHIEPSVQLEWLQEIARITKTEGLFLFTTAGKKFLNQLSEKELSELNRKGSYTVSYVQKGHRMMATYNNHQAFNMQVSKYFEVLEYYDGLQHAEKAGGQDLWIVRRK